MLKDEIKAFRKRKGLSQEELGKLCGVGKSSVSQWESGSTEPTGGARLLLDDYMSGRRCIVPLTAQEENLLNENVQRGNFSSREDFLTTSLIHLIKHGSFDGSSFSPSGLYQALDVPALKLAETPPESPSSTSKNSNG